MQTSPRARIPGVEASREEVGGGAGGAGGELGPPPRYKWALTPVLAHGRLVHGRVHHAVRLHAGRPRRHLVTCRAATTNIIVRESNSPAPPLLPRHVSPGTVNVLVA